MKEILYLRILSLLANAVYIVYGSLIGAIPIVVGSSIAVGIHAVNIYRLKNPKVSSEKAESKN
jgi:CHASE2 domain-containing sensor protein